MGALNALMCSVMVVFGTVATVGAEADRELLVKEPGVYATFAVFKASEQWWQIESRTRDDSQSEFSGRSDGDHLRQAFQECRYVQRHITKALNYVPHFPGDLQAELKTPPPQGNTYVIVVPIRKDAEWWITGQDARTHMMKEHTDATVAYLQTVKRKLYRSSGLDDWDFITYFEISRLDDFNNLVIGLLKVARESAQPSVR